MNRLIMVLALALTARPAFADGPECPLGEVQEPGFR
jgi:hypothetical protein